MAVYRVERTQGYTVMSNYHLKDNTLSLKAKGLLSMFLSSPDDWNYSTRGLASICKESVEAVGNAPRTQNRQLRRMLARIRLQIRMRQIWFYQIRETRIW